MTPIYDAESLVDAQLAVDVLAAEGIVARIVGGALTAGIGELPASGLVRVLVDDADAERARAAIVAWQADLRTESPEIEPDPAAEVDRIPAPPTQRPLSLASALIGAAVGTLLTWVVMHRPASNHTLDYNDDGKPDEWQVFEGRQLVRVDRDRNFDGKVDSVLHYLKAEGSLVETGDNNYDGYDDFECRYRGYLTSYCEFDLDFDGFRETREDFNQGVIARIDVLDRATSKPLLVKTFTSGRLVSSRIDSDGDGALDTTRQYDVRGEISSSVRDP